MSGAPSFFSLQPPSEEQLTVIQAVNTHNVVVSAVAGSGKTTTMLHIAQHHQNSNFLLLTYNARLKKETREKVVKLGLQKRVDVHSFHALCKNYLDNQAYKDEDIKVLLKKKRLPVFKAPPVYDVLLLDEVQDMTPLYFELVCRFHYEVRQFKSIVIFGDPRQSIFEFNQADPRFITNAHRIFRLNNLPWAHLTLSVSYRVTHEIASFVNECMFGSQVLAATRSGPKPSYVICDAFQGWPIIRRVQEYLRMGHRYEDFFILAPSVKSERSPIRVVANAFTDQKIPIHIPMSDEEKLDEDVLRGKIVFSSFHQVKGLERKIVFVFAFDGGYFTFNAKDEDPSTCPNTLYVATTRSQEHLVLIHHLTNPYLPFLRTKNLDKLCDVEGPPPRTSIAREPNEDQGAGVTDITRHLPDDVLSKALSYISVTKLNAPGRTIDVKHKTDQGSLVESVCEINGLAIPLYFAWKHAEGFKVNDTLCHPSVINKDCETVRKLRGEFMQLLSDTQHSMDHGRVSVPQLLKVATFYGAMKSGVYFKTRQITDFDWLAEKDMEDCVQRMLKKVSGQANFEVPVFCKGEDCPGVPRSVLGYIDCVDGENIWEFKCVQDLSNEHIVQLAIYMFLYKRAQQNTLNEVTELDPGFLKKLGKRSAVLHGLTNELLSLIPTYTLGTVINGVLDGKEVSVTLKKVVDPGTFKCAVEGVRKHRLFSRSQLVSMVSQSLKVQDLLARIREQVVAAKKFKLWNILSDEEVEIDAALPELERMMEYVMMAKYGSKERTSDVEFISSMKRVQESARSRHQPSLHSYFSVRRTRNQD